MSVLPPCNILHQTTVSPIRGGEPTVSSHPLPFGRTDDPPRLIPFGFISVYLSYHHKFIMPKSRKGSKQVCVHPNCPTDQLRGRYISYPSSLRILQTQEVPTERIVWSSLAEDATPSYPRVESRKLPPLRVKARHIPPPMVNLGCV